MVVFEHPTPRALAKHVLGGGGGETKTAVAAAVGAPGGGLSTAPTVTIATAVGRFPGGVSGRTEMSRLLSGCGDAISEVPAARWDVCHDSSCSQDTLSCSLVSRHVPWLFSSSWALHAT